MGVQLPARNIAISKHACETVATTGHVPEQMQAKPKAGNYAVQQIQFLCHVKSKQGSHEQELSVSLPKAQEFEEMEAESHDMP